MDDYRLRLGTHAVVDVTSAYMVTAWPTQSDQGAIAWMPPDDGKFTPPERAKLAPTLAMNEVPTGYYTFQWVFDYWTIGMWDYFLDTYLASGANYADVTVKAYDGAGNDLYLTARLLRPRYSQHLQSEVLGYSDIVLRFTKGVIII